MQAEGLTSSALGERTAAHVGEVRRRLDEFLQRRGYLMAHQGVMAAALPELQDAYGVIYRALTLEDRYLSLLEKEFVWLAVLVSAGEHIGKHHIDLFFKSGGTEPQAEAMFRLVAFGAGAGAFALLDQHWQEHFPAVPARDAYVAAGRALMAGLEGVTPTMARLAMVALQTARRDAWAVRAELIAAYDDGIAEPMIAEAMSFAMWPCGVNCFIDASGIWLALIREKRVSPSPAFAAWAETPGQDGFQLAPRTPARHRDE